MDKFIDCQVDNNLSALVISGFPSPSDLMNSWIDIQQEFADAIGEAQHKIYLSGLKEIWFLKVKLAIITDTVDLLRRVYYKPFADRLNKLLHTKYKFDWTNEQAYNKELSSCLNRSKSIIINIDLKEMNLEAKKPKPKPGEKEKKPTREMYQSNLITLSDHAEYQLHAHDITAFEYCERMRRWNKHCVDMEELYKKK